MPHSFPLLPVALLLAGIMGFAIQRGATCTVAAVDEFIRLRRLKRLLSMLEAALWVAGGLLIARALHWTGAMPAGYPISMFTIFGGVLLGLGAYVNQACVFGALARFGSGEWAYAATPLGFYLGCISVERLLPRMQDAPLAVPPPVFHAGPQLAVLAMAFMAIRLGAPLFELAAPQAHAPRTARLRALVFMKAWTPHAATSVIGVTFLFLLLMMGAWAYTDVLAELARGMTDNLFARVLLLAALVGGAVLGGYSAGRFRSTRVRVATLFKCLVGGVLMGWGSLMIPGSNDGLILLGMPLLWPYAWVAFATMFASIAAAMLLARALRPAA